MEIKEALRYYFIVDYDSFLSVEDQVNIALSAKATALQYRNKKFILSCYDDVVKIRDICNNQKIMFIINDNILLASMVNADGVHLGQDDDKVKLARKVLGRNAVIGLSISNVNELMENNLQYCDYLGVGPIFDTSTKLDIKNSQGLDLIIKVKKKSSIPIVVIGGIDLSNVESCFYFGADGIAVISAITRNKAPINIANRFEKLCSR